jgi:hypothetical protein
MLRLEQLSNLSQVHTQTNRYITWWVKNCHTRTAEGERARLLAKAPLAFLCPFYEHGIADIDGVCAVSKSLFISLPCIIPFIIIAIDLAIDNCHRLIVTFPLFQAFIPLSLSRSVCVQFTRRTAVHSITSSGNQLPCPSQD